MYFTKSKIATIIRFFLPLLLLTAAVSMTACAEQKHYKSTVEIITIDTKDGEDVRIPKFSTDHESEMKELMSLNDQVRDLENQYLALRSDPDSSMMLWTQVIGSSSDYLQATVSWYLEKSGVRDYNIVSLVYDKKNNRIFNNNDALQNAGLTGVELSTSVGKKFLSIHSLPEDEYIKSTEMQGFALNKEGDTALIYMKVILKKANREEEQFVDVRTGYGEEAGGTGGEFLPPSPKKSARVKETSSSVRRKQVLASCRSSGYPQSSPVMTGFGPAGRSTSTWFRQETMTERSSASERRVTKSRTVSGTSPRSSCIRRNRRRISTPEKASGFVRRKVFFSPSTARVTSLVMVRIESSFSDPSLRSG